MSGHRAPPRGALYLAVGLVAGAVIALQIVVMRVFAVGSWAHFGSLVVSLAMLGFGLTSAVMCVATRWVSSHWRVVSVVALLMLGPAMVGAHLLAQQLPFNPIFLVSDPQQKWRLLANFLLYLLPFLAGATFLGVVFVKARTSFNRFYFADLAGSGLCGLVLLGAMWVLSPAELLLVPLLLWLAGALAWCWALRVRGSLAALAAVATLALVGATALPRQAGWPLLTVSDYKGVSYARKFPDSQRLLERHSPFGSLEVYASSYLHFAPGLSDNAAFNLPALPQRAYLGMYLDGEGPVGIIRRLDATEAGYFRFLPMAYPYLLKARPETFVVQFGGGISTAVALNAGAARVTVAEANPMVLDAFRHDSALRGFTGDILNDPRVDVVDHEGRLFLAHTPRRFDVIDLSLADSAGLSSAGGFSVVEKYGYTREAFARYMRALAPGGILSVTLWNKEEPPKSVLKLYATLAGAARDAGADVGRSFYSVSSYLSTTTVLFKQGGFTGPEVEKLRAHTQAMSFEDLYYPGIAAVQPDVAQSLLKAYRDQIFAVGARPPQAAMAGQVARPLLAAAPAAASGTPAAGPAAAAELALRLEPGGGAAVPSGAEPPLGDEPGLDFVEGPAGPPVAGALPSVSLGRLAWQSLVAGQWPALAERYVFDVRELTNDRAYFAGYIKPADLPRVTDRLELLQDEWGYLLLWATLAIAATTAAGLVLMPVVFGWRSIFSVCPGKGRTLVYFACLGLGYILVEVGLIARFVMALSNATVSASVLITSMLVFSGLGSLASERFLDGARHVMPGVFAGIAALLLAYGLWLDPVLDAIGAYPYGLRLALCFLLMAPPAFLMGFPMPMAMAWLARLRKQPLVLWAWGINGSFSVVGAAAVPLLATSFGTGAVLLTAAAAYALAGTAFLGVLLPLPAVPAASTGTRL